MNKLMTLGAALLLASGLAQAGNVMVMGAGAGQTQVSETDARDIFMGRKTLWENGAKVRVCLLRDISATDPFYTQLVKKNERDYVAYWARKLFSGGGTPPLMVGSAKEVESFLETNPGGLCYIRAEMVADITPKPKSHPWP